MGKCKCCLQEKDSLDDRGLCEKCKVALAAYYLIYRDRDIAWEKAKESAK